MTGLLRVVAKLHDAFKEAIEDPEVVKTLDRFEMAPNYKNSADYKKSVDEQIKLEKAQLERIGLLKKQREKSPTKERQAPIAAPPPKRILATQTRCRLTGLAQ